MNEKLRVLDQIQECDLEIVRRRRALAELDTGEELEERIASAERELAEVQERHHAHEKEYADLELELKSLEEKRSRFQSQLYGGSVSNPRQLSDLHQEVEMLSREIGKREDRMLELMESLEVERGELAEREATPAKLRERLAAVEAKHENTAGRLSREIAEIEARRKELAEQADAQLLKRYEQIRARTGDPALVRISGSTCPGCRIALPSQTVKAAQAGRVGQTCENCGRLLVWDDTAD